MLYRISCPGCSRPLQVPEEGIGRPLRCPKCGRIMMVRAPAPVEESPDLQPLSAEEIQGASAGASAIRTSTSPPRQPISPEEPEVRVRVVRKGEIRPPEASEEPDVRVQVRRKARPEEVDEPPEEDDVDERPVKRVRRRKRKRARESSALHLAWLPWVVGAVIVVGAVTVGAVINLRSGLGGFLLLQGLAVAVMLPISTVILFASLIITTGGFDFGDPRTALLKVPALLIVVNIVFLLAFPCGLILAFPIWLFGLMWLFDLDIWEAKFLLLINWILNSLVKTFLLGIILTALMHAWEGKESPDQLDDRSPAPGWNSEDIKELGGTVERDEKDPERPVVGIVLRGAQITDDDLFNLRTFRQLRRLDLSNTPITDAGLLYLVDMEQLQSLKLTGTRVTDRGVRNLQRALPNLQVTR